MPFQKCRSWWRSGSANICHAVSHYAEEEMVVGCSYSADPLVRPALVSAGIRRECLGVFTCKCFPHIASRSRYAAFHHAGLFRYNPEARSATNAACSKHSISISVSTRILGGEILRKAPLRGGIRRDLATFLVSPFRAIHPRHSLGLSPARRDAAIRCTGT